MADPYDPTVWVNGSAPALSAANLNKMEAGIAAASTVYSVAGNDTAAITAALAAASGGGIVFFPPGEYATTGGHTIPLNVEVRGAGMGASQINHSGNNACFTFTHPRGTGDGDLSAGMRDLSIAGNSGSSAIGLLLIDAIGFRLDRVRIGDGDGGGYSAGSGIRMRNVDAESENNLFLQVRLDYNLNGLVMERTDSGASLSFGYNKFLGLSIVVPASGIGVDVGGASSTDPVTAYNCFMQASIWLNGNNAVGFRVRNTHTFTNSTVDIVGERFTGTGTSGFLVDSGGTLVTRGFGSIDDTTNTFTGIGLVGVHQRHLLMDGGTAPTVTPATGGILYVDTADSKLKFRSWTGAVTPLADP